MQPSHKVAFNTIVLYLRASVTIGITLYTTRLALEMLGVEDFGIYNLISGVVGLLSILNVAMSAASQRYLSYYQGINDVGKQRSVFAASLALHLLIGIVSLLVLQGVSLFLFDGFLNIDPVRIEASRISYQLLLLIILCSILAVPFMASINAHENMGAMALVHILEGILRLASVFLIRSFSAGDKLVWFSLFNALTAVVSLVLHVAYCLAKYPECTLRIKNRLSAKALRELGGFAGWNLMGALCGMGRAQGIPLLLNLFLGVALNAAYAIANQLGYYVSFLSSTILQTFSPQIMKSEGSGNRSRMLELTMTTSKISFFLFALPAIPCLFEMNGILRFWLKETPAYTSVFSLLLIIGVLINQLTLGLQSAIQATGKIKKYQLAVGSIFLLDLPVAWLLLKNGYPPYVIFIVYALIEGVTCCIRLYFMKRQAGLSIGVYLRKVLARELVPVALCVLVCLLVVSRIEMSHRFFLTYALSVPVFALSAYFFGLCTEERATVRQIGCSVFNRLRRPALKFY